MRRVLFSLVLASGLAFAAAAEAVPDVKAATVAPLDQVVTVGGVEVACTGIGQTKSDPRWLEYPVRVEFSNAGAEYLVGAVVEVADTRGRTLLTVSCEGPWVLLRLKTGQSYRISAVLTESPAAGMRSSAVTVRPGQQRVVLQFPHS